jgi:hypothetical protein
LDRTNFKRDEGKGVEFLKLASDTGHDQAAFEYVKWLIRHRKITSDLHYLGMTGKHDDLEALIKHAEALRTYRAGSSRGGMEEFMLVMKAGDVGHRNAKERRKDAMYIGCTLMLYSKCLALFNSVQKFTRDILGNVVTISINEALESIHPVNKDGFDHFD